MVIQTRDKFPYAWSFIHSPDGTLPILYDMGKNCCKLSQMKLLFDCIETQCVEDKNVNMNDALEFISCIMKRCSPASLLGERCFECGVIGGFNPTDVNVLSGLSFWANLTANTYGYCDTWMENPTATGGLLILSKTPMTNMDRQGFHKVPTLITRGYLSATVSTTTFIHD